MKKLLIICLLLFSISLVLAAGQGNQAAMNEFRDSGIEDSTSTGIGIRNNAETKIMPDRASEIALTRLRLKNCNEENNCTIILKEVGQNDQKRQAYEIQIQRHSRILGLFRAKMQITTQVDAETGDIIMVKKPWWAFLATEPAEE